MSPKEEITIVIADKNATVRQNLAVCLRQGIDFRARGISEVIKVPDKRELLSVFEQHKQERKILIISCDMDFEKDGEGIDILKKCYSDGVLKYLPFLITLAGVDAGLVKMAREYGAWDMLLKPIVPKEYVKRINGLIDRYLSKEEATYRNIGLADPSLALEIIEKKKMVQNGPRWLNLAGEKRIEMGDLEKAEQLFQKAVEEARNTHIAALRNLASVREQKGDLAGALTVYKELNDINPRDVGRNLQLATLSRKLGKEEEAAKYLDLIPAPVRRDPEIQDQIKKISEIKPHVEEIRAAGSLQQKNEVAQKLRESENFLEAEECYDEILREFPGNTSILYNKAVLYCAMKKFDKAAGILKGVLNANNGFREAKLLLAKIKPLTLKK